MKKKLAITTLLGTLLGMIGFLVQPQYETLGFIIAVSGIIPNVSLILFQKIECNSPHGGY